MFAQKGDFEKLRAEYGVSKRAISALFKVEAGGKGFAKDGRLLIRFEPHIFRRMTAAKKLGLPLSSALSLKEPQWSQGTVILMPGMADATAKEGLKRKGGQNEEYAAVAKAIRAGGEELALLSTSFGLPQIMGFNYAGLGYNSAKELFEAFKSGEEEQKVALLRFLRRQKLIDALNKQDWAKIGKVYNGDTTDRYAKLLASAYAAASDTAIV